MSFPEVHLIGGTGTEAVRLVPVAVALRAAGLLTPVLVATGPEPATVARALAAFDLLPDVSLHPAPDTGLLDGLISQLSDLWAARTPAAVLVHGERPTSLAAALAAAWRRIPVVHLCAGRRGDEFGAPSADEAAGRLIAQVATLHLVPAPLAAMNLLDEGVAAGALLITGDTAFDAALTMAGRRLPAPRVPGPNPYGDGRAAQRAAQATAALLGLADRPAPMPIPSFPAAPAGVAFGA
jgi:UDP-N-acetylglucosamine 2-epimerase (non-hydrolysing)